MKNAEFAGLVRPPRYSLSLISFGSPMITFRLQMIFLPFFKAFPLLWEGNNIVDTARHPCYGFFAGDGCGVAFGWGGGSTLMLLRIRSQAGAIFTRSLSEVKIDRLTNLSEMIRK